jgi:hypothetical protein
MDRFRCVIFNDQCWLGWYNSSGNVVIGCCKLPPFCYRGYSSTCWIGVMFCPFGCAFSLHCWDDYWDVINRPIEGTCGSFFFSCFVGMWWTSKSIVTSCSSSLLGWLLGCHKLTNWRYLWLFSSCFVGMWWIDKFTVTSCSCSLLWTSNSWIPLTWEHNLFLWLNRFMNGLFGTPNFNCLLEPLVTTLNIFYIYFKQLLIQVLLINMLQKSSMHKTPLENY